MQHRCYSIFTVLVLLTAPLSVRAETQYWVSVGSFSEQNNAAAQRDRVSGVFDDDFSVIGSATDRGYFYRVASGPYLTRELAEDRVRAARDQGFSGAWLWVDDSSVFDANAVTLGDTYYDSSVPANTGAVTLGGAGEDYSLSDYSATDDYTSSSETAYDYAEEDGIMSREKVPQLVEEAPAGFKLNKLRRND